MINSQPLVTVAIAAYNVEKFLKLGMESVLNQTYSNIEIILVDDGSTDNTPRLCDEYAKNYSNIKVIHKANGGLGSARNAGIDNANGRYIYFFDVDDAIRPNLIEYNVGIAEKYSTQMNIFSFNVRYDVSGECEDILMDEEFIDDNNRLKEVYCKKLLFTKHGNGFVWNKFYRMDFIKKHNFHFGNQRIQQDEPFNMQLYPVLDRVYISSEVLYNYVIYSSGNAGSRYLPNKFEIVTDIYHKFCKFYDRWNLDNKQVEEYIYNRYYNSIANVLTYNIQHKNNKQTKNEKLLLMKEIMNNNDVRNMIKYFDGNKTDDRFFKCIKKKQYKKMYYIYAIHSKLSMIKNGVIRRKMK